jgi:hypothetical protein
LTSAVTDLSSGNISSDRSVRRLPPLIQGIAMGLNVEHLQGNQNPQTVDAMEAHDKG